MGLREDGNFTDDTDRDGVRGLLVRQVLRPLGLDARPLDVEPGRVGLGRRDVGRDHVKRPVAARENDVERGARSRAAGWHQ